MIEILLEDQCVECNLCVKVCPTNVFERREEKPPEIARQDDCQTCYMCELYCPVKALYVAPNADEIQGITEQEIMETDLIGSYRSSIGWEKGQKSTAKQDQAYKFYLK
jgi:NAD-dependent dihydropyrimidine dehydrogenase PreA subunit